MLGILGCAGPGTLDFISSVRYGQPGYHPGFALHKLPPRNPPRGRRKMSASTELLSSLAAKHPEVAELIAERDKYRDSLQTNIPHFSNLGDVPPGHYYSPIPSITDIQKDEARLFGNVQRTLPGIEFNEAAQLRLVEEFADKYYGEMPFEPHKKDGLRFYF